MSAGVGIDYEEFLNSSQVTVARLMQREDANLAGNVHGGRILQMMEQAGYIAASRHTRNPLTVTGSIDHTDFIGPMHIGEVGHAFSRVTFASDRSVEVEVRVKAENLSTGETRWTNRAYISYVTLAKSKNEATGDTTYSVATVPKLAASTESELLMQEQGQLRYERRKAYRSSMKDAQAILASFPQHKSVSELVIPLGANSGSPETGVVYGGVIMKLVDEVAGLAAFRHCKTNVVTASLDDLVFLNTVRVGNLLRLRSRVEFTSSRSIDIAVVVTCEDIYGNIKFTGHSRLIFVSLDSDGRPCDVAQVEITEDWQRGPFEAGKARYMARKQARLEQAKKKAKKSDPSAQ